MDNLEKYSKVIDDGDSPDYFPYMYEPVQTITITQLLKNSVTRGHSPMSFFELTLLFTFRCPR